MRNFFGILLALSLVLATGATVHARTPAPALDDEAGAVGITREEAVALVLVSDPRFADLPDFDMVRQEGTAEFRTVEAVLLTDWYRVLGPTASALAELGAVSFRSPTSWLIEVNLVEACTEPPADVEFPMPDPCAWRHSWYHHVTPDGHVTLIGDEGDPEPISAEVE